MKKIWTLTLVGIFLTLSSQTLFKNDYILAQTVVDSYRFVSGSNIPTDGLLAYYPFNGNANDESGNGYDLTVSGATLTADRNSIINSAYSYTTNTDKLYRTSPPLVTLLSQNTISIWVYMTTPINNGRIFRIINSSIAYSFGYFSVFGNKWCTEITNSGGLYYSFPNIPLTTWVNVVVTLDGLTTKVYYNGVEQIGTVVSNSSPTAFSSIVTARIHIGNSEVSTQANICYLDDTRIYNRVLTPEEITTLYNE